MMSVDDLTYSIAFSDEVLIMGKGILCRLGNL